MASAIIYTTSIILCTGAFGVPGTAAAVVISELATLVLMRYQLQMHVELHLPSGTLGTIVAGIVMGIVVYLLTSFNIFFVVAVGAVVYSVLLLTTRALTFSEISTMLRRI
jgi:hypothetical protein